MWVLPRGWDDRDWSLSLEAIIPILIDTKGALMTYDSVTPVSLCFSHVKIDSLLWANHAGFLE